MREKFAAPLGPPDMEVVENEVGNQVGRIGEAAAAKPASSAHLDPLVLALGDLRPDHGLTAAWETAPSVPAAGPDDLDLSGLEADGRDWAGFSVDQGLSEDTTLIAGAVGDFSRAVTVPATGQVLTRRDLLADLLRAVVANLKANRALFERDRVRQQAQVQKLVRAMMNSTAAPGQAEALTEDTVKLLMGAMSAAGRGSPRGPRGG